MKFLLLAVSSLLSFPAFASINPPVDGDGATHEYCDVRSNADDGEGTLRSRLEAFNAELDDFGRPTGQGECLFGIHFLDPMTVLLEAPLDIRAVQTVHNGGSTRFGTYITGRNTQGQPLPVTIDARSFTGEAGACAFMIEGGFSTIQQIHDIRIVVGGEGRAICDAQGRDLMAAPIPGGTSRSCATGSLGRDCDFKNVDVIVEKEKDDSFVFSMEHFGSQIAMIQNIARICQIFDCANLVAEPECDPMVEECGGSVDPDCDPQLEDCSGTPAPECDPALEDCTGTVDPECDPQLEDCSGVVDPVTDSGEDTGIDETPVDEDDLFPGTDDGAAETPSETENGQFLDSNAGTGCSLVGCGSSSMFLTVLAVAIQMMGVIILRRSRHE